MARNDEATSSKSFRDLMEHFDDDDFMQYFTPDEIPEEVQTLLAEIRAMEDKIRYLNEEEEFDNYRIWRLKLKYDAKVRVNEELTKRTAQSLQLMKTFQDIEEILHPLLLHLKYELYPGVLETANNLKAAKEAKQKQLDAERYQAYENLAMVKKLRLVEAEIARIDLEKAEILATNRKLEQQFQNDIIRLAKTWKKQQDGELAAAAELIEAQRTPPPVYRHFTFTPESSPDVEVELPLEPEIPLRLTDVIIQNTNKFVSFSLGTKTQDAPLVSGVKGAVRRNINQGKPQAKRNSSQIPFFDSCPPDGTGKSPIFSQSQPSSIVAENSFSGRTSRSKFAELSIGSNITTNISSRRGGSTNNNEPNTSSGSSIGIKPVKKSMASRGPSTSGYQDDDYINPSQNRLMKTSSSNDFNFSASGDGDNTTNAKGSKSGFIF